MRRTVKRLEDTGGPTAFSGGAQGRGLVLTLILLLVVLLLPFAYAFGFLFPRGDDFDEVTRAMFLFDLPGGLYEVGREWLTWSGRYTYHFLAVFLGKAGEMRLAYGLICAAVVALYGLAVFGVTRALEAAGKPGFPLAALFCGLLAVLILLCCHQNLATFYMLTDALTMGLQPAATLCFFWLLCRLWLVPEAQGSRKARRAAIVVGVLAVGVYEHSAVAVVVCAAAACALAWREALACKSIAARRRLRDCLCVGCWCLGALLFSFLAPGNFYRRAVRQVSAEVQRQQLAQAWQEWLSSSFRFFDGLWPWAVLLLVLLLPRRAEATGLGVTRGQRDLALAAVLAYPAISGMLSVLHALSDVTLSASPKVPAGLSVYAACAFGVAAYALAGPALGMLQKLRLPLLPLTLPLLAVLCLNGNWRETLINAANGGMVSLAGALTQRYDYLEFLGRSAAAMDAPPRFGLYGEIARPGVRKRGIDPALPQAVVQELRPAMVFPIHMGETLPGSPEIWPNLWAAWLYGVGSVQSRRPDPLLAAARFDVGDAAQPPMPASRGIFAEGVAPPPELLPLPPRGAEVAAAPCSPSLRCGPASESARPGRPPAAACAVPSVLREAGVQHAWLLRARGGPNKTFDDLWLLLQASKPLPRRIVVFRASPADWRRLMPLPVQQWLLARLAACQRLELDFTRQTAGQTLEYGTGEWSAGTKGLYAFPVLNGWSGKLPALFLSLDQHRFYRLAALSEGGGP